MKTFFKTFISAIFAFCILSVFSYFYYNIPIRIESESKSTDYAWEKNKWHCRATEGFSFGTTDSKGFNNPQLMQDINILIMGSSQMEAFNVAQNESTTYKLNQLLNKNGLDMSAYNIGISGHTIETSFNNLKNAVKEFSPKDYVIIETNKTDIAFNIRNIKNLLDGNYPRIKSYNTGFIYTLQKSDYLRLLYSQYKSYKKQPAQTSDVITNVQVDKDEYKIYLNKLLKKVRDIVDKDCNIIIFCGSGISVDENNNVLKQDENFYYRTFKKVCQDNNIVFVDMYDYYADYYIKNHVFPHGFTNTRVGKGHLNKYGHEIIANTLFDTIKELEDK